jgi:acetoin utilization deacetylase AcuC-like enzyme
LIDREVMIMGGTLQCARYAMEHGIALNVAGGTHHAYADRGEGFCLLNDLALTAQILIDEGVIERALVVDLDVHQGNGTAKIFGGRPEVFTFSMHGASNYPMHKERSDLDMALEDGTDDRTYLKLLREHLPQVMDQSEPDLVLYQCGVDILETDKLGRLGVTEAGCRERDRIVFEACHRNEVPAVCAMGGGYSPEIWNIVEAHCHTFRLAAEFWG